jgi:hypothetical protein
MDATDLRYCVMPVGNGSTVRIGKFRKFDALSFLERADVFVLGSRSVIWIGIGFELKISSRAHLQRRAAKN